MLALDRMAIEEAGPNPERLAAAIHDQLRHKSGEVPVAAIAAALDIVEIKEARLKSLEGALIAPADRNVGAILVNSESSPPRRRFTLAHELGHFLNPWHRSEDPSGSFACSRADVATPWRKPSPSASRRLGQEAAYRFMSAISGNRPHFEEAIRALFAPDPRRFEKLIAEWPADIRDHTAKLAARAFHREISAASG